MTKKLTSIFLAIVMMLTIIPMGAMSALAADTYKTNIVVNDKFVTSSMKSGTGWSYDNATATLTLNGFNGKLGSEWTEDSNLKKLKIKLTGSNTVNTANFGLSFRYIQNVTFDGTGSLTIKGNKAAESNTDSAASFFNVTFNNGTINISTDREIGIAAENDLVFNGGKLNITAAKYQLYSNGMLGGGLKLVSGATVTSGVKYYKYNSDYKIVECTKSEALMIGKAGAAVVVTKATAKVGTVKLGATKYTYDGKVKSPTLTVKNTDGKTLVKGTDYTVTVPSGRKNVGKYTYKLTFKGKYSGTKSVSFTINPKNTSISKLTATKGGFKATIKKYTTQTTGYQIRYSTSSKMSNAKTVTIAKNTTTSKSVTGLSKGKKYFVQIRTYKTAKDGSKQYSAWSTAKTVTTKK